MESYRRIQQFERASGGDDQLAGGAPREGSLLFLLKDTKGRALVIAEAPSQTDADAFGRDHLPAFCESIEIDGNSRPEAEEFWDVETIQLSGSFDEDHVWQPEISLSVDEPADLTQSVVWVHGPDLPEEVVADDLLTPEDHRDLTLDHISRTCDIVLQFTFKPWG